MTDIIKYTTDSDLLLIAMMFVGCSWMATEYIIYCVHCVQAEKLISASRTPITTPITTYLQRQRIVFIFGILLHIVNIIVVWFCAPYYLIALMLFINAYVIRKLNESKAVIINIQETEWSTEAKKKMLFATSILRNTNEPLVERVLRAADELEETIRRHKCR